MGKSFSATRLLLTASVTVVVLGGLYWLPFVA
jgi:hypothetical protein